MFKFLSVFRRPAVCRQVGIFFNIQSAEECLNRLVNTSPARYRYNLVQRDRIWVVNMVVKGGVL